MVLAVSPGHTWIVWNPEGCRRATSNPPASLSLFLFLLLLATPTFSALFLSLPFNNLLFICLPPATIFLHLHLFFPKVVWGGGRVWEGGVWGGEELQTWGGLQCHWVHLPEQLFYSNWKYLKGVFHTHTQIPTKSPNFSIRKIVKRPWKRKTDLPFNFVFFPLGFHISVSKAQ